MTSSIPFLSNPRLAGFGAASGLQAWGEIPFFLPRVLFLSDLTGPVVN